jgi:hypothetical protein
LAAVHILFFFSFVKESELNETSEASSRSRSVVEGNKIETQRKIRSEIRQGENPGDAYCSVAPGAARLRQTLYPCACLFRFRRYQSGVLGKSLSISANSLSCCTMSKLDDSSGALSATAVAKETLKDRVTKLDGKVDHLGGQV